MLVITNIIGQRSRTLESILSAQSGLRHSDSGQPAVIFQSVLPVNMSKRPSAEVCNMESVSPIKLLKVDDEWTIAEEPVNHPKPSEEEVIQPTEGEPPKPSEEPKPFNPTPTGPKNRILKKITLNFKPRVDVFICLNGPNPEVRLTNEHASFTMTGEEFAYLTGNHIGPIFFDRVRLEPIEDGGCQFARYNRTPSGLTELNPSEVLKLNKYALNRWKNQVPTISDHVVALMENEDVILNMFHCVVDAYRTEYALLNSLRPITDNFYEIARVVETYVPPVVIVRAFLSRLEKEKLSSRFNYYSLLTTVLSQKNYLFELLL